MIQGELGTVGILHVAVSMADIPRVVKQSDDNRQQGAFGAQAFGRLDAALIAGDQPGQGKRHVERVLDVVVDRIAAEVPRVTPREQALEVVESEPEPVQRRPREAVGEDLMDRAAHGGGTRYLHGIADVIVVAAILGHKSYFVLNASRSNSATTGA